MRKRDGLFGLKTEERKLPGNDCYVHLSLEKAMAMGRMHLDNALEWTWRLSVPRETRITIVILTIEALDESKTAIFELLTPVPQIYNRMRHPYSSPIPCQRRLLSVATENQLATGVFIRFILSLINTMRKLAGLFFSFLYDLGINKAILPLWNSAPLTGQHKKPGSKSWWIHFTKCRIAEKKISLP